MNRTPRIELSRAHFGEPPDGFAASFELRLCLLLDAERCIDLPLSLSPGARATADS